MNRPNYWIVPLISHAGLQATRLQYDHLPPHARGGTKEISNMLVTKTACNNRRCNLVICFASRARGVARHDLKNPPPHAGAVTDTFRVSILQPRRANHPHRDGDAEGEFHGRGDDAADESSSSGASGNGG